MRKTATTASVLILCGAVLRLWLLGAKSLWFDEASSLLLASRPLGELAGLLTRNEMNPPLYYALMHGWLKAFADPRTGLRLFSALCGIASLFAFRDLCARLLPERSRLPALGLAAFSSFWIHVAQDGRAYSMLLLVSVLSARATLVLSEGKPRAREWLAYAALAVLGLYAHYYFAILLAGHAAWLASRRPRLRDFALAHLLIVAAFAPWLGTLAAQLRAHIGDPVLGEALSPARVLDLLGTSFFDVTFLGLALPAWTGAAVGAGFAALAIAGARAERRAFAFPAVHLAAALAAVIAAELWSGRPVTQARYFTPLSPMLLALAALGLSRSWARVAAGAVVLAGCAGYFVSAVTVDPRLDLIAAAIRRSSDASVPVVHLGKYYYLPLRVYYLPERRNLLVAKEAVGMDFAGMPPYPGVIADKDLPALGPCVVVDESRVLGGDRVSLGTGAQLAALRR